jgi:hypothetical protein
MRIAYGGGAVSMLQFRLEWGGDGIKRYGKMKWANELVLAQWEGSVTRHSGVIMLARGEAAPEGERGGDDASWADVNLTGVKNKENSCGQFTWYK